MHHQYKSVLYKEIRDATGVRDDHGQETKLQMEWSYLTFNLAWQKQSCKAKLKRLEEWQAKRKDENTTLRTGLVKTSQSRKGQSKTNHNREKQSRSSQLAFYVNLHRAVIGPSATLTGR